MSASWVDRFGTIQGWSQSCPICRGTTFVDSTVEQIVMPFRSADERRCACWHLYVAMQGLWLGGFPKGFLSFNFDSIYPCQDMTDPIATSWKEKFPDSYAWEMSEEDLSALNYWVQEAKTVAQKGLSLVLVSGKGTGKSALATSLAKEFVKRQGLDSCGLVSDFSAMWLVADALYEDLGKGWRGKDLLGPCMKADLLVIDDLRMAYRGFTAVDYIERVHSLLQYRSGNSLPTIITTNKIAQGQDYESNAITEFIGVTRDEIPQRFGKYRFVRLTNAALRPSSDWGC